jgi:PKD repeat protein
MAIRFEWLPAAHASTYKFQLARDAAFAQVVEERTGVAGLYADVAETDFTVGEARYWRVRGQNAAGEGPWSPVWSVGTVALIPPAAPVFASVTRTAGQYTTDTFVYSVRATDENLDLDRVELYVDGFLQQSKAMTGGDDTDTVSWLASVTGVHVTEIRVYDRGGRVTTWSETVDYQYAPSPPVAAFTRLTNALKATFTDSSTPGSAPIISWLWYFGDGTSSTEENPVHYFATSGSKTVRLVVTDANGLSDDVTQTFTITGQTTPTIAVTRTPAGAVYAGDIVVYDVTLYDLDWNLAKVELSLDGVLHSTELLEGRNGTAQFILPVPDAGTYAIRLRVYDGENRTADWTESLVVAEPVAPPTAAFGATFSTLTATFDDKSAGAITSYLWDFGDGTTSTAQNPTKTYAADGTYTVTLTVTGPGGQAAATKQVQTNGWTLETMPRRVHSMAYGTIDGELILAAGGFKNTPASATAYIQDTFGLNLSTRTFRTLAPATYDRYGGAWGVYDGKLYSIAGMAADGRKDLGVYDPATDTHARYANVLPPAAGGETGTNNGQTLYVSGNWGNTRLHHSVDLVARTYQALAQMATGRISGMPCFYDGYYYIFGGCVDGNLVRLAQSERFNPATNSWESLPALPAARSHSEARPHGGRLYIPGGTLAGGAATATVVSYDPVTQTYRAEGNLPRATTAPALASVGSEFIVAGGMDGASLDAVQTYTV